VNAAIDPNNKILAQASYVVPEEEVYWFSVNWNERVEEIKSGRVGLVG